MDAIFKHLDDTFTLFDRTREKLREQRDIADVKIKAAKRAIAGIHVEQSLEAVARKALEELKQTGALIKDIENALPEEPGAFYRHNDVWHPQLQACAMTAVVIGFILDDTLAGVERVVEMMGEKIRLPVEDYLIGVCNAIQELSRLSLNRVIKGDFHTPKRCARFANDVSDGFKQLNLKNDFLRKRFDGMKYDVKRLEEVMYDLSIRGLVTSVDKAPADAHMSKA